MLTDAVISSILQRIKNVGYLNYYVCNTHSCNTNLKLWNFSQCKSKDIDFVQQHQEGLP